MCLVGHTILHAFAVGEIGVVKISKRSEGGSILVYLFVLALLDGAAEHYIKLYSNHPHTIHTSTRQISTFYHLFICKLLCYYCLLQKRLKSLAISEISKSFLMLPLSSISSLRNCSLLSQADSGWVFACGIIINGGLYWSAQAGNRCSTRILLLRLTSAPRGSQSLHLQKFAYDIPTKTGTKDHALTTLPSLPADPRWTVTLPHLTLWVPHRAWTHLFPLLWFSPCRPYPRILGIPELLSG